MFRKRIWKMWTWMQIGLSRIGRMFGSLRPLKTRLEDSLVLNYYNFPNDEKKNL